jgi:hypothetical protein
MTITINGDSPNLTSAALASPVFSGTPTGTDVFTSGTVVASTSGTSVNFTSIPSWVKRITVILNGVSTNGTSDLLVQLGDLDGVETTSYVSLAKSISTGVSGTTSGTTGFAVTNSTAAATLYSGNIVINLQGSNTWVSSAILNDNVTFLYMSSGIKTLSATLDRVRITTVNGTDTFDAGSINILYE